MVDSGVELSAGLAPADGVEHGIISRADGVYAEAAVSGRTFQSAVDGVFAAGNCFAGLNYALFIRLLFGIGPALPADESAVRFADKIVPFDPVRRALYRAVKIESGTAEYYFEPVFIEDADDPFASPVPAQLTLDEFIADMWSKGIRFGIDVAAVRAAIVSGKQDRVTVARALPATPGQDAVINEVSDDIHRNDAPRQLANGKLDLMSFQNRFPQIKENVRLLHKVPRKLGVAGIDLAGFPLEPAIPADVDLQALAGPGMRIEHTAEGEFLVSTVAGFLNVDTGTGQLSVGAKIVSYEGVSTRTTGNLQLTGDYEEFGEIQEKRVVEGENITVHADVFGNVVSRGGTVTLNNNLVGGSASNARGNIHVKGVASSAIVQAAHGEVTLGRAENCVISGTRVSVEHAVNCEIMADVLTVGQAEGCAVAARSVTIGTAGPRRQIEMLVYALVPDDARINDVIAQLQERVELFHMVAASRQAELDTLQNEPDVRKYVMLASKIRKKEITLTADQVPQFQKMALAVGPQLKAIGKLSLEVKSAQSEGKAGADLIAQLVEQKNASSGASSVEIGELRGDVMVRTMRFNPDGSSVYHLPVKEIKARLRGGQQLGERIASGSTGSVHWSTVAPSE
ncbi:flagellar assembly protein A [Pseudoduganella sp. GCM10020061]|uniref:flagellar assembly protein A n=1 Tax=Pseudoduganella sp. GCM10020061 TaxID=3317345 RepID=UPI00362F7CFD